LEVAGTAERARKAVQTPRRVPPSALGRSRTLTVRWMRLGCSDDDEEMV
jgi:hypothetical protein